MGSAAPASRRAGPPTNRLLDGLPARERKQVLGGCCEVQLHVETVLAGPGDRIRHIYFPTDCFISMIQPMGGNRTLEVALAGREGLYGVPVALGVPLSPVHAAVQGGGGAWRMGAGTFRQELARLPALRTRVARYTHVLMSQLFQAAGCNRFHVVEQRVARWMLVTSDRARAPSFHLTQEFLASMLGVRRVGVTEAAGALQRRGLIGYSRGVITILDRPGLEQASCACYRADRAIYERLLG